MEPDKTKRQPGSKRSVGVGVVRFLSGTINLIVLVVLLLGLFFGCYAIWDTHQLYQAADADKYEVYKPTAEDDRTFSDFQEINSEVIGWITVYGTSIDYPVVQAADNNSKYLSLAADLTFSAPGSIFLDYRNRADFTDFNSIIYGHHMAESAMFGDVDKFLDESFFEEHRYGCLYAGGRYYGLDIFAFLQADAYDQTLYTPGITGSDAQEAYLNHLLSLALYDRGETVTIADRIVLMNTCSEDVTNGRMLLAAKLTDEVMDNPFPEEETSRTGPGADLYSFFQQWEQVPFLVWALLLLAILLVILWIYDSVTHKRKQET